ncbi:MAG: YtxH domain-containing protein [Spirochaetes bacterium]|nr:YtxH domain-containing protein [Spirochaetota bacterium]
MAYRDNGSSFGTSFASFIAGSLIGAGVALLYAPQSGERTRQEMREKAERTIIKAQKLEDGIKDTLAQLIEDIRSKVSQLVEEGKYLAEDKKQEILAAIEAGKQALEEERKKLESNKEKA